MSDCPTVHTLHGPFTDQTSMLYWASPAGTGSWPSPTASRPWGHPISVGPESLQRHPPGPLLGPGRQRGLPVLPGPGRRGEGAHVAIEAARRAGRRLVTKTALLARAAGLLFPIQWPEPFGLVMTEAMACGTPVIAWRNGSVPEVTADGRPALLSTRSRRWRPPLTESANSTPRDPGPGQGAVLSRGHGDRLRTHLPASTRPWR